MALHSSNTIILWNAENGEKIWSATYGFPIRMLKLDPFHANRAAGGGVFSIINYSNPREELEQFWKRDAVIIF